jgi:hypothetical protein
MPLYTCTHCGAELDASPSGPCSRCGSKGVTVGLEPLTGVGSLGDVSITVGRAIEELAAMPAEQARAILEYAANIVAPQPLDLSMSIPSGAVAVTGEGRITVKGHAVAHATALATQDAVYVPPQASVWRGLLTFDAKDGRDIRNMVIGGVLLYLAQQNFPTRNPAADTHTHLDPHDRVVQVDPRASPSAPPPPSRKATVTRAPATKHAPAKPQHRAAKPKKKSPKK